jgi:hypothetical protein
MFSMKLLLTFSLLTGIVAEECTVDFDLEDFSDKITVTNTSESDAFVAVMTNHGQATIGRGGKSRTATVLLPRNSPPRSASHSPTASTERTGTSLFMRDRLLSLTQKPQNATPKR